MVAWAVAPVVDRAAPAWEAAPVEAWEVPPETPEVPMLAAWAAPAWEVPAWGMRAVPPMVERAARRMAVPARAPEEKAA